MKKAIFLLVLILAVVLSACGNKTDAAQSQSAQTVQPAAETPSSAPAATPEAKEDNSSAEKKNEDIIVISMSDEAKKELERMKAAGGNSIFLEENFEPVRQKLLAGDQTSEFPEENLKCQLNKGQTDGFDVYSLTTGDDYERIVLYIHGGAWVLGIDPTHVTFCDSLAENLKAKVYMPLYPLGAKYSSDDTYKMIWDLYTELEKENKPIILMGDSAGGNVALGLMHLIKENNAKMPERLVLLHPCADATFSNPDMEPIEKNDACLAIYGCRECMKMWVKDKDPSDPLFSALNADVSGYPKTLMFVGNDILYPDDMLFYDKMKQSGVDITVVNGEGLWHVFSISYIPERQQSLDLISGFVLN